eukprot:Skav206916  [mRNA]  locus=scaffold808:465019:466386:+ [translate_table: standard]
MNPMHVSKRVASFAIVLLEGPAPLRDMHADSLSMDQFRVLFMGRCAGRQVINRAELQAVLGIFEHTSKAIIFTDSQYVVDLVHRLKHLNSVKHLHKCPSYDLLLRAFTLVQSGEYDVIKVKAHQEIQPQHTYEEKFRIMGNNVVDEVAQAGCKRLVQQLHSHCTLPPEPLDYLLEDKTKHWQYLYQLKMQRAALVRIAHQEQIAAGAAPADFFQWAQEYCPQGDSWHADTFTPEEVADIASMCMWGTEFATAFYRWSRTLLWKPAGDPSSVYQRSGKVPLGISWTELTINFILLAQQWVPTPVGRGKHAAFRVQSFVFPDRTQHNSFPSMVLALQSMSRFWDAVTGRNLLPRHELRDVRSLRYFGQTGYCRGFGIRPQLQHQAATIQIVREFFKHGTSTASIACLPEIPIQNASFSFPIPMQIETESADSLDQRFQSYRLRATHVRAAARRAVAS